MKILNADGKLFQSQAQFPLVDPTNGNVFEPGVLTKATATDWLAEQPAISAKEEEAEEQPDPTVVAKVEEVLADATVIPTEDTKVAEEPAKAAEVKAEEKA